MSTRLTLLLAMIASCVSISGANQLNAGGFPSGDPQFDSNSIANAEANQWRWLSAPKSRLCINPAPGKEISPKRRWDIPPMGKDLPLDLGGFVGTKAFRLMKVVTVGALPSSSSAVPATQCSTTWFPYQITFKADFPGGIKISGTDFFANPSGGILRLLKAEGPKGSKMELGGMIPEGANAAWNDTEKAVVVTGSNCVYALKFARQETDRPLQALEGSPVMGDKRWTLPVSIGSYAVSVGFATSQEGSKRALALAAEGLSVPVSKSIAKAKSLMDGGLRKVPVPGRWGFGSGSSQVGAEKHRQAYYAAWAFLLQNTLDVLPENPAYPFPQVAVGKPSLWDEGDPVCPATCSWESLFGYQWYALLDPEFAWKSFEGLMSLIDAEGKLGGESLPSRKAQTAWFLHQIKPDRTRLAALYPAIKRYLLWREKNPRWIYIDNDAADEKDIEFVVSWLFDVDYARQIARELALEGEDAFWSARQAKMLEQMRPWFYSNPEAIEQFYFADTGAHATKRRFQKVPIMITTALCLKDLPQDLAQRTEAYFKALFNPQTPVGGFGRAKHPDLNLTAYGLIDRKNPAAKSFLEFFLGESIRFGEFAEVLELGEVTGGVKPSLFTPLSIIEFTWLLNNLRSETGIPTVFEFSNQPSKQAQ